jgi:hypothetical protein
MTLIISCEVYNYELTNAFHVSTLFQRDHLNCDPTFELEEMIVETRPLHKKKKRLAKQRSLREMQGSPSVDLVSYHYKNKCDIVMYFTYFLIFSILSKN